MQSCGCRRDGEGIVYHKSPGPRARQAAQEERLRQVSAEPLRSSAAKRNKTLPIIYRRKKPPCRYDAAGRLFMGRGSVGEVALLLELFDELAGSVKILSQIHFIVSAK